MAAKEEETERKRGGREGRVTEGGGEGGERGNEKGRKGGKRERQRGAKTSRRRRGVAFRLVPRCLAARYLLLG